MDGSTIHYYYYYYVYYSTFGIPLIALLSWGAHKNRIPFFPSIHLLLKISLSLSLYRLVPSIIALTIQNTLASTRLQQQHVDLTQARVDYA